MKKTLLLDFENENLIVAFGEIRKEGLEVSHRDCPGVVAEYTKARINKSFQRAIMTLSVVANYHLWLLKTDDIIT